MVFYGHRWWKYIRGRVLSHDEDEWIHRHKDQSDKTETWRQQTAQLHFSDTVSAQKSRCGRSHQYVIRFYNWMTRERQAGQQRKTIFIECTYATEVSSWMTMTRHPLTTRPILLRIDAEVSTLQNKSQSEGLIQWNEKPVLPDKPRGFAAHVWNVTALDEAQCVRGASFHPPFSS